MSKSQVLMLSIIGTLLTTIVCVGMVTATGERSKGSLMNVQDSTTYSRILEKCLTQEKYSAYECRRSAEDASKAIMSWDGNKWVKAN